MTRVKVIQDPEGAVIGFERLYFKPKTSSAQKLSPVPQTAKP